MKILLAMDAFPPIIDGAVTALMTLARGFHARGHEVSFAVPHQPQTVSQNGHRIFRARSVPFPTYKPYRFAIPWVKGVRRQMKDHDFDLFHIHSPFGMGMIAQQIAAERKIPCLFTMHTLFPDYLHYAKPFGNLLRRPMIAFLRRFCHSVDRVVTQTNPIKSLLLQYGVSSQVDVIPLGVDPATITPAYKVDLHKKYGIPEGIPILLFAGRLGIEKNLPWLMLGLQEASRRNLPFHCFLVGDGNARGMLETLVDEYRLREKVTFTGFLAQSELAHYYANSELFCIPSMTETQCLSALEAMTNGSPVLGVRAMGIQETIRHGVNGILTDPNPDAYKEALCRLLLDKNERGHLREGALSLSHEMTADPSIEKHLKLYQELMDRREGLKKPLRTIPLVAKSLLGL